MTMVQLAARGILGTTLAYVALVASGCSDNWSAALLGFVLTAAAILA